MNIRTLKDGAKLAATYLAESGIEVPHTRVLEALSRAFGERNWSTLAARLKQDVGFPEADEVAKVEQSWTPSQGAMPEAVFVRQGGIRCVYCGSQNLASEDVQADGPQVTDSTRCDDCGSTWTTCYSVSGFMDATRGDNVPEPSSAGTSNESAVTQLMAHLEDVDVIVLTALSEDQENWLGYVFNAKQALAVLARSMQHPLPGSVAEWLAKVICDEALSVEKLHDACVRPLHVESRFDDDSAREAASSLASAYKLRVLESASREDLVDEIVEDVRARAREYGFSHGGTRRSQELARESAIQLNLRATESEILAAAARLA